MKVDTKWTPRRGEEVVFLSRPGSFAVRFGSGCGMARISVGFWVAEIRGFGVSRCGSFGPDFCGEAGRGFWRRGGLFLAEGCGFLGLGMERTAVGRSLGSSAGGRSIRTGD